MERVSSQERKIVTGYRETEYMLTLEELQDALGIPGEIERLSVTPDNKIKVLTIERQSQQFDQEVPENPFWFRDYVHTSRDGTQHKLRNMATRHLVNCANSYGDECYHLELQFRNEMSKS